MEQHLKRRAPRNRTITLTQDEQSKYRDLLLKVNGPISLPEIQNRTIHEDLFEVIDSLPDAFVDLLFLDPPYNLNKRFNTTRFKETTTESYAEWLESCMSRLGRLLKPTASVYICGDWRSCAAIQQVAEKQFVVRNRVTWEREKGRGAKRNWKNCSEDIWYCTVTDDFHFDAEAIKLKRRVLAPYTDGRGEPKDWERIGKGGFRLTYSSNLWTDLSVPFWSMPENTDHPTQKPEKLLAKVILASSRPGDLVFDPFLGSGTTSVVAKKLGRRYCGVEIDATYCCLAEKRLELAKSNDTIQGYSSGVFWERNTLGYQNRPSRRSVPRGEQLTFDFFGNPTA
jgi:site-specific DNA-methyltransferase (adenine-specific)